MNPSYVFILPAAAYLYGSIPFGFLMAKWVKGVDIRSTGSGNIGATNAARVLGFKFFPLIFVLDFSKGFLSAFTAQHLVMGSLFSPPPLAVVCALSAILGHVFPVFLHFRGGKAVAAGTGAFTVLAPWSILLSAAIWGLLFASFRYVSLASITAALALGISVWLPFFNNDPLGKGLYLTLFATLACLMILILHRANISRLLSGTEHKIGAGGGKQPQS